MKRMIRALVVDDEEKSCQVLIRLLRNYCPDVQVCAQTNTIEKAYGLAQQHQPDIVFLDVQLPSGNGFNLLKKYETLPFEIVFVTGHDKYAVEAIRFNALGYLLKPIEICELQRVVARLRQKLVEKETPLVINLINNEEESAIEKKIPVHQNEKVMLLGLGSICMVESDNRYCHITTRTNEKYTISKTLKELESFLIGNAAFVRISKNAMLNVNYISDYNKGEPCFIKMQNGNVFEISRRKKQEVLERLKR